MKLTWEECAEAGMTLAEASRARGVTRAAGSLYAKNHGLVFRRAPGAPLVTDEARAKRAARLRAQWAAGVFRPDVPRCDDYRAARRKGYSAPEARALVGAAR